MQDQIVFVLTYGIDLETIKNMDVVSFRSLHESCTRNHARDLINYAYLTMTAAQGTGKNLKDAIKPWTTLLSPAQEKGLSDFMAKYGKGL